MGGNIRSAVLPQEAALQLPFPIMTPPVKKGVAERPQAFRYSEI